MKTRSIRASRVLVFLFGAIASQADEALARKSGCFECHAIDKSVVGPSYREIASKYKNDAGARAALFAKVKHGGKGNWTNITKGVPMPPHQGSLKDAEIQRLVDWVRSL